MGQVPGQAGLVPDSVGEGLELIQMAVSGSTAWTNVCRPAFKVMEESVSCQTPGWAGLLKDCG